MSSCKRVSASVGGEVGFAAVILAPNVPAVAPVSAIVVCAFVASLERYGSVLISPDPGLLAPLIFLMTPFSSKDVIFVSFAFATSVEPGLVVFASWISFLS